MRIIRVKWRDLVTYSDRMPLSMASEKPDAVVNIVGFLISEDDDVIRLAHMVLDIPEMQEQAASDYSVIPKGCIIERSEWE